MNALTPNAIVLDDPMPSLTTTKYTVDEFGLHIHETLTFDEWVECGRKIWQWRSAIQWAIGDLFAYGEDHFGEEYAQALSLAEYSAQTVANYASVSRVFPPERRVYRLSHSHYDAARGLRLEDGKPDRAAQDKLLALAVSEEWSREDVREEVRWRKALLTSSSGNAPALTAGGNDTPPKLPPTYDELYAFVRGIAMADLYASDEAGMAWRWQREAYELVGELDAR